MASGAMLLLAFAATPLMLLMPTAGCANDPPGYGGGGG